MRMRRASKVQSTIHLLLAIFVLMNIISARPVSVFAQQSNSSNSTSSSQKAAIPQRAELSTATQELEDDLDVKLRSIRKSTAAETLQKLLPAVVSEKDPVKRYVLLDKTIEHAVELGELDRAYEMIDLLDQEYDVDTVERRLEAITARGKIRRPAPNLYDLGVRTVLVARELYHRHEYERALDVLDDAQKFARRVQETGLYQQMLDSESDWEKAKDAFDDIKNSYQAIVEKNATAKDRTDWGRFLCFERNEWSAGLEFIAAGETNDLSALAEKELSKPTDFDEVVKLMDAWLAFAETQPEPIDAVIRDHAYRFGQTGFEFVEPNQLSAFELKMAKQFAPSPIGKTTRDQHGLSLGEPQANPGIFATFEVWIRTTDETGVILYKRSQPENSSVGIRVQNGKITFWADGSDHSSTSQHSTKIVNDGKWHHIAVTKLADRLNLFVDGQPDGETLPIQPTLFSKDSWHLGYEVVGNRWPLEATYARVRISNTVRYHYPFQPDSDYAPDKITILYK